MFSCLICVTSSVLFTSLSASGASCTSGSFFLWSLGFSHVFWLRVALILLSHLSPRLFPGAFFSFALHHSVSLMVPVSFSDLLRRFFFYFSSLFFSLMFHFPPFSTSLVLSSPGSKLLFLKSPAFPSFCPHSMFIPLPFTWHWFPCVANLAMDLKGLKSRWSSAHPWEAWHLTPPCVPGRHHWGACFTFRRLWRRCFHSFQEKFFIKQTCTLPDQKGIMWTFYEPNVEINGGKKEMLEMWAVRRCLLLTPDRARLIIHHIAGSSNLLQNVFFISICVGGSVQ